MGAEPTMMIASMAYILPAVALVVALMYLWPVGQLVAGAVVAWWEG